MTQAGYHPTADQLATVGAVEEAIADILPLTRLREQSTETDAAWAALDELGLFMIGVSEERGGVGLGVVEEALIAYALGKALAHPSVIATLGAAHGWTPEGQTIEMPTPRVAAGYQRQGRTLVVEDAAANLLLVRDGEAATLFEQYSVDTLVDDRNWLARISTATASGSLQTVEGRAQARLRLLDAAVLAGIAQTGLDMAVAYAQMRVQFGRPIGTFQAIKHHCANMAIGARTARDQVSFAAVALEQGREEALVHIESALVVAGNAAIANAGTNIQIHGGIGFSEEADPHLVLKRAQLYATLAGGVEAAIERLSQIPELA